MVSSTSPLSKRRCVFLDRDGVINVAPPAGEYITSSEQLVLLPNICDWIRLFRVLGYLVIVVTNQRCVASGIITVEQLESIHERLQKLLAASGAEVNDIYYCPHGQQECKCRKPEPGMVYSAQKKWAISLDQSIMIGDSENDEGLAQRCGMTFVRVKDGRIEDIAIRHPYGLLSGAPTV